MKKIWIVLFTLMLVGCGETKTPTPITDTVDKINESKEATAVLQVNNLLKEAEMKWLTGLDQKCISVSELSTSSTSGSICLDDSSNMYAKDVIINGYTCNGYKTTLKCVGGSND